MGAPSTFTPELGEAVCALIASGWSVRKVARTPGMPTERTIFRWLAAQDEPRQDGALGPFATFRDQYIRAREVRADARFERIDAVIHDMRCGRIDHNKARVEIDAIKWQTGKEAPKRYGEAVTLRGDADNPLPAPQFIIAPIAPAHAKEE